MHLPLCKERLQLFCHWKVIRYLKLSPTSFVGMEKVRSFQANETKKMSTQQNV